MVGAILYRPKTVAATLAAVAAIAIPALLAAKTMREARPVASPMVATSVGWADRVFVRPGEFARWLRKRGVAYTVWARRHPRAATRLGRA